MSDASHSKGAAAASPEFLAWLASKRGQQQVAKPTPKAVVSPPAREPTPATPPPPASPPEPERATFKEVVEHGALDSIFFSHQFFPKTFRQASPNFHKDIWCLLDDPNARYVNIQVFRGGAKTSILRTYIAKRIAYGLSRTIMYIGASEDKAKDSLEWIKKQVAFNNNLRKAFGLEKGRPWQTEKINIKHGLEGHEVNCLAIGITGSLRGVNLDDHRPDLIVVDDVIKDDNAATPEQRLKIAELILGAVKESLAPASEVPDAKMVIINTPQDFEDISQKALQDPQFRSARFGCWTPETEELPVELQESAWPERWSSETLREEKRAAVARNMLSTFAREMECRLVTTETSSFRGEWLRYFGEGEEEPEPDRDDLWIEYVIDPAPPPSDQAIAKGLAKKDFEAHAVVGRKKGKYFVLEIVHNRGHDPSWTIATFFELCTRWAPRKLIVEAVAYQRALVWLIKEAMKRTGRYIPVMPYDDKRKKQYRITQGLNGPLSNNALYVRRSQTTLISQIIHYPGKNPNGTFDDDIEAVAVATTSLSKGYVGDVADNYYLRSEDEVPELEYERGCP